jgi:hypothetical protein
MATTTLVPNPDEPPRGLRFTDPTADIVWAAIQTLDEAAKHEVLAHLRDHLAVPDARQTDRQVQVAKAVAALREAAEILAARGDSDGLTSYRYEELRRELDRKGDWPPESSIRRYVAGTWNDALRRAQLDPVADGDAFRTQLGGRLTREECAAAVRQCAEETNNPLPGFWDYINWAKRPDVRRRPGRRPHSQTPFDRLFDGWASVLVAAGLAQEGANVGRANKVPGASTRSRTGYGWTEEQLGDALRTIAARLGRSPKTTEYAREREDLLAEREEAGEPPIAFPSMAVIQNRYRSWDAALVDAGLEPTNGKHEKRGCAKRRSPRRIPEEEMLACLREAFAAIGHPFTTRTYTEWRKRELEACRRNGIYRRIPAYFAIYQRFGDWPTACQRALGDGRG